MFYLLHSTYKPENIVDLIFLKSAVQKIYVIRYENEELENDNFFEITLILQDDRAIARFTSAEEVRKVILDITEDEKIASDYCISEG